jgi:hypothetical protein
MERGRWEGQNFQLKEAQRLEEELVCNTYPANVENKVRWQMGFNPANVENKVRWQMRFNSAYKGVTI